MALAIVGEAFLSASVNILLKKIISPEFVNFFRSKKLDVSLLDKLQTTLLSLQAALNDAEEKQITNTVVKDWLDKLRDVIFDAEDLLDEISTEALRCKVKSDYRNKTVSGKGLNILSSRLKWSYGEINSKMQTLFEKLQNFAQQIHFLGLTVGVSSSAWHGTPTSSVLVDESAIYGRDGDRKTLKDHLLSEDGDDSGSKIGVISIVGMGGIGNTVLAKLLYNDLDVQEKFELKAWAHISKDFDICKVTQTLLESLTSKTVDTNNRNSPNDDSITSKITDTSNPNTSQVQLQQLLSHKKFLLILDDIWEASYVDWNNLKDILNAGQTGSRIIITTRNESVALSMQTFLPIHKLEDLESEDCWSLFAKHAFGPINYENRSNLEVIGKRIAEKCGGLPLAAVALGGLLRNYSLQQYWKMVLESNIWDLQNVQVQPALLLSYHYLPSTLKRCFAYCSIFPKNSRLVKKMVVQLWIAEDLVHLSKRQESLEEIGDGCFDELVSRSLILQRSVDGEAYFEMHDLINDLATMVSSPYCVRLDEQKPDGSVRHLSYNRGEYDSFNKFDALHGSKVLRTFLPLPLNKDRCCYLSNKVIDDFLLSMKHLWVLSLANYSNVNSLDSIGKLIYLRYLDLSGTMIRSLPSATCKLYNLQTLLLSSCEYLTKLPKDMGKLVNLRHLDISGTKLCEMPAQIASLQNLQSLSDFIISKHHNGLKVAQLNKFPQLRGKLSISNLENVTNPIDASLANLKMKEQIDELVLGWGRRILTADGRKFEMPVLERLEPSTNLKKLSIIRYGGTEFPNWLGNSSFGNMVYLTIWGCAGCSLLPPLGQLPKLKELCIGEMKSVKTIGGEFYGSGSPSFQPFPYLEILRFKYMSEWEEWNLSGGTVIEFPRLTHLSLEFCPKLNRNLPAGSFPSLSKLYYNEDYSGWHFNSRGESLIPATRFPLRKDVFSLSFNSLRELFITATTFPPRTDVFSLPFNSLRELSIQGFHSLTSFPRDGLPRTLQSLSLISCGNLEFLPCESLHNYKSLENLEIQGSCNSMESFTLGSLPVLKSLSLNSCTSLKSILVAEDALQSLSLLQSIDISSCNELESFSPAGLPTPNLIHFEVSFCNKLKSLPEQFNTLVGLQELKVHSLPNLQSFAKGGLPANLRELGIGNLGKISWNTTITEWGLQCLICLSTLLIFGDDIMNTLVKMEEPLLPISLTYVGMGFLQIERLDGRWLQHLTSLQDVMIMGCSKLKSLPEEGLPSSLKELVIRDCPSLDVSVKKKKGKEWPKIAHIPTIFIDDNPVE